MYPVSRTNLQNYREIFQRQQDENRLIWTIDYISENIFSSAARNDTNQIIRTKHFKSHDYSQILLKLKERFPDTDFLFDPGHTYLMVSWAD